MFLWRWWIFRNAVPAPTIFFSMEAEYSDLSGLTVQVEVGGDEKSELKVALNFDEPDLILFTSVLDRFPFQPSFNSENSLTDLSWSYMGKAARADLKIGDQIFPEKKFELVSMHFKAHAKFHDVAGIVSFCHSSTLLSGRILRLELDPLSHKIQIASLSEPDFTSDDVAQVVSIPALPSFDLIAIEPDRAWVFFASVFLGEVLLSDDIFVQVDPSSSDMVLPEPLSEFILFEKSKDLIVDPESGRLYVSASSLVDQPLFFDFPIYGKVVKILPDSLEYPREVSLANQRRIPGREEVYIPLRVRFDKDIRFIKLGRPLLASCSRLYLDNITQTIHLVLRKTAGTDRSFAPQNRSILLLKDVFDDISLDPSIREMFLHATDSLDQGLIPWTFTQKESGYELKFIRRYRKPAYSEKSSRYLSLSVNTAVVQCVVDDTSRGMYLRFIQDEGVEPDRTRYTSIEILRTSTEVSVLITRKQIQVQVPLPFLATAPHESSCGICKESINADETIQNIPPCNHKFHADCIYPWLHANRITCPICRSFIPRVLD